MGFNKAGIFVNFDTLFMFMHSLYHFILMRLDPMQGRQREQFIGTNSWIFGKHNYSQRFVCSGVSFKPLLTCIIISNSLLYCPGFNLLRTVLFRALESNLFSGSIPPEIGKLVNLESLSVLSF